MNQHLLIAVALSLALAALPGEAQEPPVVRDEGPERPLIYTPADLEWRDGPASLEPGAQFVVLEGDFGEPGFFTMQIRMPDGFLIAPHWHPAVERVTVISGTFSLGHGDVVDRAAAQRLPAGSHFSLPREMRHFAFTEGETIIQLSSIGPWEIHYVNPADDPRTRGQ